MSSRKKVRAPAPPPRIEYEDRTNDVMRLARKSMNAFRDAALVMADAIALQGERDVAEKLIEALAAPIPEEGPSVAYGQQVFPNLDEVLRVVLWRAHSTYYLRGHATKKQAEARRRYGDMTKSVTVWCRRCKVAVAALGPFERDSGLFPGAWRVGGSGSVLDTQKDLELRAECRCRCVRIWIPMRELLECLDPSAYRPPGTAALADALVDDLIDEGEG